MCEKTFEIMLSINQPISHLKLLSLLILSKFVSLHNFDTIVAQAYKEDLSQINGCRSSKRGKMLRLIEELITYQLWYVGRRPNQNTSFLRWERADVCRHFLLSCWGEIITSVGKTVQFLLN